MDFRKVAIILSSLYLMAGCSMDLPTDNEEHMVGDKVDSISSLTVFNEGGDAKTVALFDKTTRKIHQFDVQGMTHTRSISVLNPDEEHYVLFHEMGNFIIDLTKKHISIYDRHGLPHHNPIQFVGKPVSTAFRPELGYLVTYDDLASIGFLKLSSDGDVLSGWVTGPILDNHTVITAGDIVESGHLILALSDQTLAVVDIEQTLQSRSWSYTSMPLDIGLVRWLAPVRGAPHQVFVRTDETLALYDMAAQAVISEITFSQKLSFFKHSKFFDPHLIFRDPYTGIPTLAYIDDSEIQLRESYYGIKDISISQLSLSQNKWTYVESAVSAADMINNILNPSHSPYTHSLKRFSFKTMLAEKSVDLPKQAAFRLANDYIFALFPSELGYAKKIGFNNEDYKELRLFNVPYIKQ